MGSLTKNAELARPKPKVHCKYCLWYSQLDAEDKVTADSIMNDTNWYSIEVWRFFRENGCPAGENAVRNHRNGSCTTMT